MNTVAFVLVMLAIGALALIVQRRQRHEQRVRMARVMASLRMVVNRENGVEAMREERPLLRAS